MPEGVVLKTKMTKVTTKKSNAVVKAEATIKSIKAKEQKTAFDLQKLANAVYKVEQKSISHVYKQLSTLYTDKGELAELVRELAGKNMPNFKAFATAYKGSPCMWYGFATLRKLNPKFKLEAKIKRQNKAEAKK